MVSSNRLRKVTFDKEYHYEFTRNKFDIVKTKTVSIGNSENDFEKNLSCDIFYYLSCDIFYDLLFIFIVIFC